MINRVIIDGFLGDHPEVRKTQSNKSVCNISIAQTIKNSDGNEITKWYRINAWDRTADYLGMYCKKGDLILIEGRMDYRTWEENGQKRSVNEITAEKISMERYGKYHEPQNNQPAPQTYQPKPTYQQTTMTPQNMIPSEVNNIEVDPDDLPF